MIDKEKAEIIKKCSDCYWYSDVTVQSCDKEYEPTKPDNPACDQFEQKTMDLSQKRIMITEPELLNERLERLAMVLDEIMPHCALLVRDALALLKEQEPKQVIGIADSIEGMEVGYCPSCSKGIVNKKTDETKFCKFCGQAVKWDD